MKGSSLFAPVDRAVLAAVSRVAWWAHSKFAISNFQIARWLFSLSAIFSLTWCGLTAHSSVVGLFLMLVSTLIWCTLCAARISRLPRDEQLAMTKPDVFALISGMFWRHRLYQLIVSINIDIICALLDLRWYVLVFRGWATMFALADYFSYVPRAPERAPKKEAPPLAKPVLS